MARRKTKNTPQVETRTYTNPGQWLSPQSQAGIYVTPQTAMNFSAVFAAINTISTDIASLPCIVYKTDNEGKSPDKEHPLYDLLLCEPNNEVDAFHFTQSLIAHVLQYGNGYAEIVWGTDGNAVALHLLDPRLIRPKRNTRGALVYLLEQGETTLGGTYLLPENIIHVKGLSHDGILGYSPIAQARQTIGLGMAQEIYGASFYGNNAVPSGFLKTSQTLKKESKENKKQEFEREHGGPHGAFKMGVLSGDWEWISTSINPVDAQYLASREFSVVEIARWFKISPVKLQDLSQAHYNNVQQLEIDYATNTLRPWLVNYEYELNRKLLAKWERQTYTIRHDLSARLRGDESSRVAYYNSMFGIGAISRDEIRQAEDLNLVPGGDRYFLAANNYAALDDMGMPLLDTAAQYYKQPDSPTPAEDKPAEQVIPVEAPVVPDGEAVQDTALNGAQIESFLEIISAVTAGQMPAASAKGIIEASFPSISAESIEKILGPLASFIPAVAPAVDSEAVNAVRAVLVESVARIVRREATALRRALKKPDKDKAVREFYQGHETVAIETVVPVVLAYNTIAKRQLRSEDLVRSLVDDSRDSILSSQDIETTITQWERGKASEVVTKWEEQC